MFFTGSLLKTLSKKTGCFINFCMKRDPIEKRRFIRIKYPCTIHIYYDSDAAVSTYAEDVSCGGCKIVVNKNMKPKTEVEIEIYVSSQPVKCRAVIAWCKEKESDFLENTALFEAGMEFIFQNKQDSMRVKEYIDNLAE